MVEDRVQGKDLTQRRNDVVVCRAEGTVTKRYLSGTAMERRLRYDAEVRALSEVPQCAMGLPLPELVAATPNEVPRIVMRYTPHDTSLDRMIHQSASMCIAQCQQAVSLATVLHEATVREPGPPVDLAKLVDKYGSRHEGIVGTEIVSALRSQIGSLSSVSRSMIHCDLKADHFLVRDGDIVAVIDWEHYREGTSMYDVATFLTNTIILAGMAGAIRGVHGLAEVFAFDSSPLRLLYLCVAARTLVEHAPALYREEYGPPEMARSLLKSVLRRSVEASSRLESVDVFIETLAGDLGQT